MPWWSKSKPGVHSWIEVLDEAEIEVEIEPDPHEVGAWVELYRDRRKEWRWRRIRQWEALPPEIVCDSGEGYMARAEGLRAARRENVGFKIIEV